MTEPNPDESTAMRVVKSILDAGVDGLGPLSSSEELAHEFEYDDSYSDVNARVNAMIRWESTKNFGTGLITGLGGFATMPITVPASMTASWIVQARLAGAIAHLHGYSTKSERVRTMVLLSLLGDAGKEVVKDVGIKIGNKMASKALDKIPGKLFIEINKKVGFRLITKAGKTGVINMVKLVPAAGGIVSGTIDAAACAAVGKTAHALFSP